MAATPPNPAPHDTEPRQPTALSAVFRRIADPPPLRVAAPAPRPRPPLRPLLLGFAEAVVDVPPVEDFLPRELPREAETAPPVIAPPFAIAVFESAPPSPALPELALPELALPELALPEPAVPESEFAEPEPPEPEPPEPELPEPELPEPEPPEPELSEPAPPDPPAPRPEPKLPPRPAPFRARVRDLPPGPATSDPAPPRPALAPRAKSAQAADQRPADPRAGRQPLARNRRLYRRATLPAEIEIAGVPSTLIDVSIGGFAATGVPQLEPNALVPVTLRLTIDSIEVGTQLSARIIYVTQGRSAGRFIDLSPSQMAFLRYVVTWRGESVGAVGTTMLLDAIAGGPERGFKPGSGDGLEAPKSRWWAGLIGRRE